MKDDIEKLVLMKCISDSWAEFPYPMDLTAAMRAVYPRFIQINDNPVNLENDNPIKVLTFKIKVQITPALFNYLTRYDGRPSGVSSRFSFYINEGFVYILYRNSIYNRLVKDALYEAGYSHDKFVAEIYRGKSLAPLYITSIGINLQEASFYIRNMAGKYRILNILKVIDQQMRIIR